MSEEEIAERLRSRGPGQEEGLRALYTNCGPAMLRFFVHMGASENAAKDILQETMIRIARGADGIRSTAAAKSWFWQVARNCLTDHLRSIKTLTEREVFFDSEQWEKLGNDKAAPSQPGASGQTIEDCVSEGLRHFSKEMPDRAYVLTLQMEGTSIQAISEQIGRTVSATKEYLSQCRKKIQPFIAHCSELLQADT